MASYLVQSGSSLYRMSLAGVATAITLPTDVVLYGDSTRPIRPIVFQAGDNPVIVVVNGATQDFYIDYTGTARRLQVSSPISAPVPTAGAGTGLTGIYNVACSFKIKDSNGATLIESGLSPLSTNTSSITNKSLRIDNLPLSGDTLVNARGLYRTLAGGSVLYPWFDIDNNQDVSDDRAVADSLLSLLPTNATRISTPPDFKLIATWLGRLWAVPRVQVDHLRWTDESLFYGWSADNDLIVPPLFSDAYGVTALVPRRDSLGVARRRHFYQITGNSNDSFQRVGVSEEFGCVAPESVVVYQNTAYMLGERGVNEWSDLGMRCVSDSQVSAWFQSDDYFNRSMFPQALGKFNPDTTSYELVLASAGSSILDRWIAYDLNTKRWFGPHKTDAFRISACGQNSSARGALKDANSVPITAFGATDGYIYRRDNASLTDNGTAVIMDVDLPFLSANEPDLEKVFGEFTIHSRAELGGQLILTPIVGDLTSPPQPPIIHDLRLDRERLPRLGQGRYCQLNIKHSSTGQRPRIFGIELPFSFVGRR